MTENSPSAVFVWGHRGAMDYAPQNTLASFRIAQEQGADGVELDVQLTHDGTLVVFHDARVDALTEGRGPLASLPWATVSKLDAGSHFGRAWRGQGIPTLEAVLEALDPRMTINIELKTSLSEQPWWERWFAVTGMARSLSSARIASARREAEPLVAAVGRLLKGSDGSRIWISSFDPIALLVAREQMGTVRQGFLHSPTMTWNTPAWMRNQAYEAWHPHHSQVIDARVDSEHQAGRKVHVWTVNDPSHAKTLARQGVDAIITNRPAEVLRALGR